MDEEPETDEGYVTLVNAGRKANGDLYESKKRTGMWAWKHYHRADGTTTYTELKGDIVFDGVDFGYTDDKMVLHDIRMYANDGQKIAFVGSTGAGKTTITNLINRFYDIQDGKIRYDGININKIKKADLRRKSRNRTSGHPPIYRDNHGKYPLRQSGGDRWSLYSGGKARQC